MAAPRLSKTALDPYDLRLVEIYALWPLCKALHSDPNRTDDIGIVYVNFANGNLPFQ
jgi:hypothetical protein